MIIYYVLAVVLFLTAAFSYYTGKKMLKIGNHRIYFNSFLLFLIILVLYSVSSLRYGIGNDYSHYMIIYNSNAFANYEWLFALLGKLSFKVGLSFQTFIFVLNLFVYIPLAFLIDKCVKNQYKLYSVLIFYLFNFFGASFNYIRQFPAIIMCFMFAYYLSFGYKGISKKLYVYLVAFMMALAAVGFHKTIIIAFVFVLAAKFRVINQKNVFAITLISIVLYFINPYGTVLNWIDNIIVNNVSSAMDIAWSNRLLNTGASLVNRILFFPVVIIISRAIRNNVFSLCDNNEGEFDRVSVIITYLYYLLISINLGSEMIDRILLPLYIYNIFSYPIILETSKNYKYGKIIHRILYLTFIAIGFFVLFRQLNANVYQITPYRSIFD